MSNKERALSIFIDKGEAYIENGSGGFAKALTHKALLDFFGSGRVYMVERDPRKAASEEPVDVEELMIAHDTTGKFPKIKREDDAYNNALLRLAAQGYKITRSTQ